MKIFLSSTVLDLRDLRVHVESELRNAGHVILASERGTVPVDSKLHSYEACIEAAKSCDCLIAIIDGRFGGEYQSSGKSITEIEIDAALAEGKHVFVFVRRSVWDSKEVYRHYRREGYRFIPTKIISDERVLGVIDRIRSRKSGNWIFLFDSALEIINIAKFQIENVRIDEPTWEEPFLDGKRSQAIVKSFFPTAMFGDDRAQAIHFFCFHERPSTYADGTGNLSVMTFKEIDILWARFEMIAVYEANLVGPVRDFVSTGKCGLR